MQMFVSYFKILPHIKEFKRWTIQAHLHHHHHRHQQQQKQILIVFIIENKKEIGGILILVLYRFFLKILNFSI